jgi:hypothetical protein
VATQCFSHPLEGAFEIGLGAKVAYCLVDVRKLGHEFGLECFLVVLRGALELFGPSDSDEFELELVLLDC